MATASNRKWNQLQTQKLLIFIKRQRNLFEFSLSFFSETVYNTFISKCSEELIMNRILIVEDDKDISRELKELLENSGYEAVVLTDFKNACDSIIAAEPDLVLLDINIPYMNGEMLLQQLRSKSLPGTDNKPVPGSAHSLPVLYMPSQPLQVQRQLPVS